MTAFARADNAPAHETLKHPSDFDSIPNPVERSRATFREVGKLIENPRCRPGLKQARNVLTERRALYAGCGHRTTMHPDGAVACSCLRAINVENELIDAQSKLDRPGDVF